MLSTQIKSCLFLLETDSFCSLTVALHTQICQPTVKIRITSLSLLSQGFSWLPYNVSGWDASFDADIQLSFIEIDQISSLCNDNDLTNAA